MKEIVYKSLLMIVIGLVSANVRSFEFKYEVTLEPTNEEKVELDQTLEAVKKTVAETNL